MMFSVTDMRVMCQKARHVKFKCKGCGKVLIGDTMDAGKVTDCPNCAQEVKIPCPGIGIGAFWIYWLLINSYGRFQS